MAPASAHLRVYEPLSAFPEPDRGHWTRYLAAGLSREQVREREATAALRRLLSAPAAPLPVRESPDALVRRMGGVDLLCPLQSRLRSWHALEGLLTTLSDVAAEAAVPASCRARAVADRERWLAGAVDLRVRTRVSTWEVPLAWFVLVRETEREPAPSAAGACFLTAMATARTRAARALRTLRDTVGDDAELTDEVEELARWLELFHPRSLVELDYGGVAALLGEAGLAGDDSPADLQMGLEALASGDVTSAAAAYRRLTQRWDRVRALARAS